MKIAVNLVSDHTIPNVLFIKEMMAYAEFWLFITTEKMRYSQKVLNIVRAAGLHQDKVREIVVDEYDFSAAMGSLEDSIDGSDEYFVNITCGTKLMSLAAYQVFRTRKSVIYYHGLATDTFIPIYSFSEKFTSIPIQAVLTLKEFLTSYGLSYISKQPEYSFEQAEWMKNHFLEYEDSITLLRDVRNSCKNVGNRLKKNKPVDLVNSAFEAYMNDSSTVVTEENKQSVLQLSKLLGFNPKQMSKRQVEYIIGGWFEEYIFFIVKQHLNLPDDTCSIGVTITKNGNAVSSKGNEFDVVFLRGTELHVIECKSSIDKQLLLNTLYKQAAALRRDFGLRIKSAVITMSMETRKDKWKNEKDRAEYLEISLFDGTYFDNDDRIREFAEQVK